MYYAALEPVCADLKNLEATLACADAHERVRRIVAAFDATAQRISDATCAAADEDERAALRKLYRGMVAAQRIALRLEELSRMDAANPAAAKPTLAL